MDIMRKNARDARKISTVKVITAVCFAPVKSPTQFDVNANATNTGKSS